MEVQHASHFPIQAWSRIDTAISELESLSNDWIWKNGNLKMAGIGNPDFLIKDILSDGVFRPFVPDNCIKRNQSCKAVDSKNLEVAGDDENEEDINLFDDENEPKEEVVKYVKETVDIQIGSNNSQPLVNSNQNTLDKVVIKLKDIVK